MSQLVILIIAFAVIFVIINIFFYFLKKKFRLIAIILQSIFVISVLLFAVFGYLLFQDASEFVKNVQDGKIIILLVDGTNVKTGIIAEQKSSAFFEASDNIIYSNLLAANNFEAIKGDSYKVVLISKEVIEGMGDYSLTTPYGILSHADIMDLLFNDQAAMIQKLTAMNTNLSYVRAYILGDIISKRVFGKENMKFLVTEFRSSRIIIYPDTIMFKAIHYVPLSWIPVDASITAEQ